MPFPSASAPVSVLQPCSSYISLLFFFVSHFFVFLLFLFTFLLMERCALKHPRRFGKHFLKDCPATARSTSKPAQQPRQ